MEWNPFKKDDRSSFNLDSDKRMRKLNERLAREQKQRDVQFEKDQREAERRLDRMMNDSEARLNKLMKDAAARSDQLMKDAAARSDQLMNDAAARSRSLDDKIHRQAEAFKVNEVSGFTTPDFEDLLSSLGFKATGGLFSEVRDRPSRQREGVIPREEAISPAEATRRRILPQLPLERQKALGAIDTPLVTEVIANILDLRQANPDITDWKIHIGYRRAIEVESPDPIMLEQTKVSGILLEGMGREAKYPF